MSVTPKYVRLEELAFSTTERHLGGFLSNQNHYQNIVKHRLDACRPACGEGAVFKGALVGGRAGVGPLVPSEIAGGSSTSLWNILSSSTIFLRITRVNSYSSSH